MFAQKKRLILGGPGCGKTTRCLAIMENALEMGIPPERIALVTFTRAGAKEAKERANLRFGIEKNRLKYFKTIHALCFMECGLSRSDIMSKSALEELGDIVGEQLTGVITDDSATRRMGDLLLTLDNYARTTRRTLEDAHHEADQEVDWFHLKRFSEAYQVFREDRGIVDFTEMLERYVAIGQPVPVDIAIVDEAQDLSPLQWAVVAKAFKNAREVWIAGDDDQSIYKWSGADEKHFLSLPYEREVLPVSHRLPEAIFNFGQEIIQRVSNRFAKNVKSGRAGGRVDWVAGLDEVDFSEGSWLLLARTRNQLGMLENTLRSQGVVYTIGGKSSVEEVHSRAIAAHEKLRKDWEIDGSSMAIVLRAAGRPAFELDSNKTYKAADVGYDASVIWHDALIKIPLDDREYYLACRRRGEQLHETSRVRIDTIHGSKGAEAEHVVLLTDLTYKVQRGYERDPDSEHKVFYVGTTRARETLTLLAPQTTYSYAI